MQRGETEGLKARAECQEQEQKQEDGNFLKQLASALRQMLFLVQRLINIVILKSSQTDYGRIHIDGILTIMNSGRFSIGAGTKINSSKYKNIIGGDTRTAFIIHKNAVLRIGENVRISNSTFQCTKSIIIGDHVMIGGSCKIWDTDFHSLDPQVRAAAPNEGYRSCDIVIESNVFIGGFSIILKGVTIGRNSVVAAGSVVTRNIPANEVWGGNPAKFLRKL